MLLDSSTTEHKVGSQPTSTDVKRNGAYIGATQHSGVSNTDGFDIVWTHVLGSQSVRVTNQRNWNTGYLNCYKNTEITWDVAQGSSNTYLASLKADNPVAIKFAGSESGASSIKVENTGTVELTGSVGNTKLYETGETSLLEKGAVTITSQSGDIKQLGGGLYGKEVNLTAAGSIRDVTITAGDSVQLGAALTGTSTTGDDTHIVNVLVEGNKGSAGDVSLTALGGASASLVKFNTTGASGNITCLNDNVVITGRRIDLATQNGSITGKLKVGQTPLGSDTLTASLNAYAASDITLTQVEGDPRLGSIISSNGDVTLIAPEGSIADALPYGALTRDAESNLITSWLNAGLITSVEGDSEEGKLATQAMVAEKNKAEQAAAAKEGRAVNSYVAIEREALLYTIQDSIINPKSEDLPKTSTKNPNIQANNVTLLVKDSVGLLGKEKNFTTDELGTTGEGLANLKALSQADASTVTWYTGEDNVGYITIKEQLPIGIQTNITEGKVTVGSYLDKTKMVEGSVFLQGRSTKLGESNGDTTITNKDLTLESIRADKDVSITSLNNIYNGAEDLTPAIVGASLTLTAAGSIGEESKLLTTALFAYNTLQAVAKQGIYLVAGQKNNFLEVIDFIE